MIFDKLFCVIRWHLDDRHVDKDRTSKPPVLLRGWWNGAAVAEEWSRRTPHMMSELLPLTLYRVGRLIVYTRDRL